MTQNIHIEWKKAPEDGHIQAEHAKLRSIGVVRGEGSASLEGFRSGGRGGMRLALSFDEASVEIGPYAARINVLAGERSFTFMLRDVNLTTPIWIPEYGVVVTTGDDPRRYEEIEADIRRLGLLTENQRLQSQPEETYEDACDATRKQLSPIWLGLSRDMRLFSLSYNEKLGYWGVVEARYHSVPQIYREDQPHLKAIHFAVGRGSSCSIEISKRLEDGCLPIVRSEQHDGPVRYDMTAFVTLESQTLAPDRILGTSYELAYANAGGCMLSEEEQVHFKEEMERYKREAPEETVCCLRFVAVNTDLVPRYAWFKSGTIEHLKPPEIFDSRSGFTKLADNRIMVVSRLNGQPMPSSEVAVLLQPGEPVSMEMLIPHQPISPERAEKLADLDFDEHLNACREYWREKLASGAQICVPEAAVDERIRAGLLHLDIAACGAEPDGSVAATIGWYAPIGSESAPIIQFFDSMGWHELARRCLQFFLDRQREDGFIQNYCNYQLETGPVLWTLGEHYRYTRDDQWVRSVTPNILKACEYLIGWRTRNKREELRGRGYGLLDGKVADPDDFFHSFMLNALSYIGIARAGEMLEKSDPAAARRISQEAAAFREDIRAAYFESMASCPVIPLGDGSWAPSSAPWTEYPGPLALYSEGGSWFTHASFGARDSLIGSSYLAISEVFDPEEQAMDFFLKTHQQLFNYRNTAFSQPYYARHDFMHIRRGEAAAFLKTYYSQFASLQDRETYNFWEHFFGASEHKTHEEGWFLMETRWMLYYEKGDTLALLPAIPRRWMEDGKRIDLKNCASYFGSFDLSVISQVEQGVIEARLYLSSDHPPKGVLLRLPHPDGKIAREARGGTYDPATETVRIDAPSKEVAIILKF